MAVHHPFLLLLLSIHRRSMSASSKISKVTDRQKELGTRWAESYDCWVNAPGSVHKPIYTCPQTSTSLLGTNEWPQAVRKLPHPIFGMTASNPRGEEWSAERNRQANAMLQKELEDLTKSSDNNNRSCCWWWHGLGFGETWQEKGFIVSCERTRALDFARKYEQAAVYEFVFMDEEPHVVLRKTLPVLVPNVEADVRIITCPQPPFATSCPDWEGSA